MKWISVVSVCLVLVLATSASAQSPPQLLRVQSSSPLMGNQASSGARVYSATPVAYSLRNTSVWNGGGEPAAGGCGCAAAPACGCDAPSCDTCDSGCGRRFQLFHGCGLFHRKCKCDCPTICGSRWNCVSSGCNSCCGGMGMVTGSVFAPCGNACGCDPCGPVCGPKLHCFHLFHGHRSLWNRCSPCETCSTCNTGCGTVISDPIHNGGGPGVPVPPALNDPGDQDGAPAPTQANPQIKSTSTRSVRRPVSPTFAPR